MTNKIGAKYQCNYVILFFFKSEHTSLGELPLSTLIWICQSNLFLNLCYYEKNYSNIDVKAKITDNS